jgi:hypothetical protein
MERVVARKLRGIREAGELLRPRAHVEIPGDDERHSPRLHEFNQRSDVLLLELGIERPREMDAGKLENRAVHLDPRPTEHERDPGRIARPIDAVLGEDRTPGEHDDAALAEAERIA